MAALSGPLLSADYLRHVAPMVAPALPAPVVARFAALRAHAARVLGPATHPVLVASQVALPLVEWLGWPRPEASGRDPGTCTLIAPGADPVALVVVSAGRVAAWTRRAIARTLGEGERWAIVTDGQRVTLLDALRGESLGRMEIDLDACVNEPDLLAWLPRLLGPGAFVAGAEAALPHLISGSDAHGRRVCRALRGGVAGALESLTEAVALAAGPRRGLDTCYADALTAIYRVLFLLFAEARTLVPTWHPVYRRAYTVDALRARLAEGRPARGTWAALQAMARLAHSGGQAGDLRVTAFNGKLFAPSRAPLLDHLALDDDRVARALLALCFTVVDGRRDRIAYADLGVEELGSVYESLLDCEPGRAARARTEPSARGVRLVKATASVRKTTGTFYTPRVLADTLVAATLGPLVAGRRPDEVLRLRVLDPAMGSGAFLVAAARYLASAWERAVVESGEAAADDIAEADRAATRRTIARQCLFGVDRNPMAVQLAQLSVWLATLAADRPLSFLDHHLVSGNSLVGASPLDVLARPPGRPVRRAPLPLEALFDWAGELAPVRVDRDRMEREPDDTVEAVREKERTLASLSRRQSLQRWKAACDLWCAAWIPGAIDRGQYHALLDRALGRLGPEAASLDRAAARLDAVARALGCFHWPLEFPEVFLDAGGRVFADGGFDAVVGNPPWEMLRADRARAETSRLEGERLVRFARDSGAYAWQGRGHPNQVQLFVERALQLTRPGGRVGLLVPATVLTDEGSAPLRRALVLANGLDTVTVFDNRRALFPIHRSVRFAAVTVSRHARTEAVQCRFGVADPVERDAGGGAGTVTLTPSLLDRLSGPGLAIPYLPTPRDVGLVDAISRAHPPLTEGWQVAFGRELNATDDRDCLRDGPPRPGDMPVVEGRHLSPFRVDLAAVRRHADPARVGARLGPSAGRRVRLAYRDVSGATNRTTLIAAMLPSGVITVHTVFCLRGAAPVDLQRVLCALLNSFVANYLVRRRVTTHVTTAIIAALPVPRVTRGSALFGDLLASAALLEQRRDGAVSAGLNAAAAEAWGLDAPGFGHILETFPLVAREERAAAMAAFTARTRLQTSR